MKPKIKENQSQLVGIGLRLAASVTPLMFGATPAFAQQAKDTGDIGDIIVTAQRREQNLIDVPAAITAIGGEKLGQLNMSTIASIQTQIPNFTVKFARGANTTPSFNIRGLRGDELAINESSIAVYTDDAYLGDVTLLIGSIFDVQRVEVLRGPQGTLFGRNTTGGLVHFISAKPTKELSGYANVLYGEDNEWAVEGAVSGPITEHIRARVSGRFNTHDGHYTNEYLGAGTNGVERKVGDREVWAVRGIVDMDLGEDTLLRIIGGYSKNNSQTIPQRSLGAVKPGQTTPTGPGGRFWSRSQMCNLSDILAAKCLGYAQIALGAAPNATRGTGLAITNRTPYDLRVKARSWYTTANLTHDFGWGTLTAITHYNDNRYVQSIDGDYGSTPSIGKDLDVVQVTGNTSHEFSQEVRLNGSTDAFDWVTGAYFYQDKKYTFNDQNVLPATITPTSTIAHTLNQLEVKTRSEAVFAQLDNHLSDKLTLTVGARYSAELREAKLATTQLLFGCLPPTFVCVSRAAVDIAAYRASIGTSNKAVVRTLTGRLALTWEPSKDQTYYTSYSRGAKSPGFSFGFNPNSSPAANSQAMGPVGQETLDAFELGAKWRFLNGRLTVNSAAFFYNFDGKQATLTQFNPSTSSTFSNYINVGTAQMYGAETEINFRPTQRWDFTLSGGALHSKITKSAVSVVNSFGEVVPLQGIPLDGTHKWNFNFVGAYHLPLESIGTVTLQGEVNGTQAMNPTLQNEPLGSLGPDRYLANVRLFWESQDKRYNAQLFVTNVFNHVFADITQDVVLGNATGGRLVYREGEGRLWGVKLGATF